MKNTQENRDQDLLNKIQNRIRWDIRVSNSDVDIQVINNVVILNGYFDKSYRHSAAVSIITTTEGVAEFVDRSNVVDDYFRADNDLKNLISKQIMAMALIEGEWIDIEVCDGVVKLEGRVFRPRIKGFAARSCWELSGIKDCINLIDVRDYGSSLSAVAANDHSKVVPFLLNTGFALKQSS